MQQAKGGSEDAPVPLWKEVRNGNALVQPGGAASVFMELC